MEKVWRLGKKDRNIRVITSREKKKDSEHTHGKMGQRTLESGLIIGLMDKEHTSGLMVESIMGNG